jgi:hypothetical protein
MNEEPRIASVWKGRLLMSFKTSEAKKPVSEVRKIDADEEVEELVGEKVRRLYGER